MIANALIDNRSRQAPRGGCGALRRWLSGIQHFRRRAGHGNDSVWKAWMPASHSSHTFGNRFGILTFPRPRRLDICLLMLLKPKHRLCKGLVTDVSGQKRNAGPSTLTPFRALVFCFQALTAGSEAFIEGNRSSNARDESQLAEGRDERFSPSPKCVIYSVP